MNNPSPRPSSPRPSSPSPNNFSTKDLQFAAYLLATTKLKFTGCKLGGNEREVLFQFDDPDEVGDELELDFESGATASAIALFTSLKFMRRRMTATLEGRLGERRDGNFDGRDGFDDGGNRKGNLNHGVEHNEYRR